MAGRVFVCFLMIVFAVVANNALICDPNYTCNLNPCFYTKCSAGFQCINCNCTFHCVAVTSFTNPGFIQN